MKIQSILKQCGGAAIKLKNEKKNICKIVKILLLILLFLLGIYGVYYLFDTVFNGMILDWISNHFVHEERTGWYDGEQKVQYIYERVDWQAFKYIAVVSFVFFAGIIGSSVYIILHFSLKKQQKKLISRTAEMIHDYMKKECDVSEIFPQEFSEISTQLVQIKADMERQQKKLISRTAEMIHDYMKKECDVSEIFPQEFSEISTQLVQIKADMERKEQYLKMETQKKNDLITYLAHDLKTPLTSVMGYLNLLEDAPDMPLAQREKYTHIARKKAERLDSLIQEFFEITRYNLQNITLEKENIDLYYMLIQMKEEFYPVLAQKGNTIELKVPEDLQVYGDADKLARVFNNIIRNAVSYSYPSSVITIEGEKNSDGVCLFFRNKGKTIPKEKLSRVFQKFFRIDEARSSDSAGSGLGLAIAKEIVELHGGSISAISEQEETVFQIVLPEK